MRGMVFLNAMAGAPLIPYVPSQGALQRTDAGVIGRKVLVPWIGASLRLLHYTLKK